MFSDILTPLPALGIEFDVVRGSGPIIDIPIRRSGSSGHETKHKLIVLCTTLPHQITGRHFDLQWCSLEQVKALTPLEDPQTKLPFVQQTLAGIRAEVGNQATVLGFVGTPWTLAAYSIEGKADK